jgi:uncharacterized RDD family membrane protein YckC
VIYAGIATRGIALAIDAALANLIVLVIGALVALIGSLVGIAKPDWLVAFLAGAGWLLFLGGYFTLFWSTTGQTPGMRLMRLRVESLGGGTLHASRAFLRAVLLALCIIPLFAGFVTVLFDNRRRGVHDLGSGTVVVYVPADALVGR